MTYRIVFLSLIVATSLLASSFVAASIPRVSAFDPGGPPVGGAAPSVVTGNWEMINYQPTGGSYSPQNQISKDNVQYLETKWVFPFPHVNTGPLGSAGNSYGSITPTIIVDGIAYVNTNDRRIFALDAGTGRTLWMNDNGYQIDAKKIAADFPWLRAPGTGHVHAMNYYRQFGWLIPSVRDCTVYAVDVKTGKTAWTMTPDITCGTTAEFGDPTKGILGTVDGGFQGWVSGHAHPPQFLGNIMFIPIGGSSGNGGRPFITAFDMTDPQHPKRLYRNFLMPPPSGDPNWDINECNRVSGNGWFFEYPRYLEGINHPARDKAPSYLATKCNDVDPEAVKNDFIDMVSGSPTFGKIHTASQAGSAV